MKFVHSADVHLDSPLRGLEPYEGAPCDVEDLRHATRKALENLVDLCLEEQAAFLLIAGDLYDGDWPDFRTGLFFIKQMARLGEHGIPAYVALGNHDAESKITKRLPDQDNVYLFKSRKAHTFKLPEAKVAIHGQSYSSAEVTDNLARAYPPPEKGWFNIGVLHSALEGRAGHEPYAPCSSAELGAKGYDYWALGHVHSFDVVSRDPHIVFPGCLQGRHVRETGPKGCALVEVQDGQVASVEPRSVDVLRWANLMVDASGARTTGEVLDRIKQAIAREFANASGKLLAARVQVHGTTVAHAALSALWNTFPHSVQAAAIEAGKGRVWIEKVKVLTQPPEEARPATLREDAMALLLQIADEAVKSAAELDVWDKDINPFLAKIPSEATTDPDFPTPSDPQKASALLQRARDVLLSRVAQGKEEA